MTFEPATVASPTMPADETDLHSRHPSFAVARLVRRIAGARAGDLPAAEDPLLAYPRLAAVLSALALPVVLATAVSHVGGGFAFRDVVVLTLGLLAAAAVTLRIPWVGHDARWLGVIAAVQVVFVASLDTMTGGGGSPYFALYAPVLVLAAWYLRGDLVASLIGLVAATEIWRAMVIERSGDASQVTIALPFFAGLAVLSWLTAHRLNGALVTIRQDQVRTAAVLDGIRSIGAEPSDDPLAQLVSESERIFGGRAGIVTFQGIDPDAMPMSIPVTGDDAYLRIPVTGARGHHALLQLWRDRPFAVAEVRLASILAAAAAKAADGRWLLERIREESERDSLTGLLNRRAFDRDLVASTADTAADDSGPASTTLFFIDVDGFKAFNDEHGHAEGDRLLQRIAERLLTLVRHRDRVYRFGGDEFTILATGLTATEADALAERIGTLPSGEQRRRSDRPDPSASLSIGIARADASGTNPISVLEAADAAMYAAKRQRPEVVDATSAAGTESPA